MYQLLIDKITELEFINSGSTVELKKLLDELRETIKSNYREIKPSGISQKESDENGSLLLFAIEGLSKAKDVELKHNFPTSISDDEHSFNSKKGDALSVIDILNKLVREGLVVKN